MSIIKLLDSNSLIGKYFIDTNVDYELVCFSRKNKNHTSYRYFVVQTCSLES